MSNPAPEQPEQPPLKTFADAEALLATKLANYESRKPQQIGAEAVEKAIATGDHLLLQAGTGVGKSFMGSIPAILSGRRCIISTATKALQSQIVGKDLPFLEENLKKFSWMMLQGRSNYFCSNRARAVLIDTPEAQRLLDHVQDHLDTFSGLREDFPFEVDHATWYKVCAEAEECQDLGCKNLGGCFAIMARQRAKDCQIVVVNHALLCADIQLRSETDFSMLGEYDMVFVDEVHELVDYAKSALGQEFSEGSIRSLLAQVRNFARRELTDTGRIDAAEAKIVNATQMLWMAFSMMMRDATEAIKAKNKYAPAPTTLRLKSEMFTSYEAEWIDLLKALREYANLLLGMAGPTEEKAARRWKMLTSRANRTAARFQNLIMDRQDESVRWLETRANRRGEKNLVINSQPIMVDWWLREHLYSDTTFIGMSATAEVGGSFDFIAKRMGLDDFTGLDVGTMFDYPNQAIMCVPRGFPEPTGRTYSQWQSVVPSTIQQLLRASNGRALVLFTSFKQMESVYAAIAPSLPFTCLKQGAESVPSLTRKFREDVHSVLFATRSFMTGIDIQGEALSMVILDKLVFDTPDDPVFEAECEVVEARGGSSFNEVSMPKMLLVVQQAAGRLIRTQRDRGAFVLLDSRVLTKGYGQKVRRSLPPMTFVDSLVGVDHFFGPQEDDSGYDEDAEYDEPF